MVKRSELTRRAMAFLVSAGMALGGIPSYAFADDGAAVGDGAPVEAGAPDAEDAASDGGDMIVVDGQAVSEEGTEGAPEEAIAEALEDPVAQAESGSDIAGVEAPAEEIEPVAVATDGTADAGERAAAEPPAQGAEGEAAGQAQKKKTAAPAKNAAASVAKAKVKGISSVYKYTGKRHKPKPTSVTLNGKALVEGTDYSCSWGKNVWGAASVTIHGKGRYTGSKKVTFRVAKPVSKLKVGKVANQTYTGTARTPKPSVKDGSKKLKLNKDYTLSYAKNKSVGTATLTIKGKGKYYGKRKVTFKVVKAKNTLVVKGSTQQVGATTLAGASQTLSGCISVSKARGKVTYSKKSGDACLSIDSASGKITVQKGTKVGTYSIVVAVRAAGTKNYKALTKNVTVKVKVLKAMIMKGDGWKIELPEYWIGKATVVDNTRVVANGNRALRPLLSVSTYECVDCTWEEAYGDYYMPIGQTVTLKNGEEAEVSMTDGGGYLFHVRVKGTTELIVGTTYYKGWPLAVPEEGQRSPYNMLSASEVAQLGDLQTLGTGTYSDYPADIRTVPIMCLQAIASGLTIS